MATKTPRRSRERRAAPHATLELKDLAQVRALSHPLRLRLLELFARRPRTTKQAAEALGQPPTRLYHHVAALERAGLVRLRETRPNRGAVEKYYEAAAQEFEVARSAAARLVATPGGMSAMGLALFDQARTELIRALPAARVRGAAVVAARGTVELAPAVARATAVRLRALVGELCAKRTRGRGAGGRLRRYSLTIAFLPLDDEPDES